LAHFLDVLPRIYAFREGDDNIGNGKPPFIVMQGLPDFLAPEQSDMGFIFPLGKYHILAGKRFDPEPVFIPAPSSSASNNRTPTDPKSISPLLEFPTAGRVLKANPDTCNPATTPALVASAAHPA